MRYDYFVAIRIPDASRDAANALVASLTGNPADEHTFVRQATNGVETQWVTQLPMREQYFAMLDDFRAQLGGEFAIMSQRLDGVWVQFGDIWSWLAQAGYSVIEDGDGTD
jgi:hypothetical protein